MNFEATKLPDTPLLRAAFSAVAVSIAVDAQTPRAADLMGRKDPMRTPVDAPGQS